MTDFIISVVNTPGRITKDNVAPFWLGPSILRVVHGFGENGYAHTSVFPLSDVILGVRVAFYAHSKEDGENRLTETWFWYFKLVNNNWVLVPEKDEDVATILTFYRTFRATTRDLMKDRNRVQM